MTARISKPLGSLGTDSQPGGPVRQPYLTYRPARLHRHGRIDSFVIFIRVLRGHFSIYSIGSTDKYLLQIPYLVPTQFQESIFPPLPVQKFSLCIRFASSPFSLYLNSNHINSSYMENMLCKFRKIEKDIRVMN